MKKIITVILTAVTLFGSMCTVMADSNSQPANKLTMPGWTVNPDRVTRVYNSARQSWEAKIVNAGNTNWIYPVMYYVPQELLDVSHTYTISAYLRTESKDNVWVALDWAGKTNDTPHVPQLNSGAIRTHTGLNLAGNNKIGFGFTGKGDNAVLYVDDLKVLDETTGEYLDLPNLGFEEATVCTAVENAAYENGKLTWTLPDEMVGNGINIYKRDLEGNKELLNEVPVSATDLSCQLDIESDSSYYIDIYTCHGEIESSEFTTISVVGDFDFGTIKLYNGDRRILGPEKGTLTVNVPLVNNKVEEGVKFTIVAQVAHGTTVTNISSSEFTAMQGDEFEEYTLDIDVEELTDNTKVEIYIWDGINEMNILHNLIVF